MKLDLHMHTRGSDGRSSAAEIVERAIAAGLDGICITDHHRVRTKESDETADLARKCGLLVFRGMEYSSAGGHMLLYGVTDELVQTFGRYADPQAVINAVNQAGGAVTVSHPFKGYKRMFGAEVQHLKGSAAWEGYNGQCTYQDNEANRKALALAKAKGRRTTGGSDAHDARDIGLAWTEFPEGFTTDRGLVRALKRGGYRAVVNAKRVARNILWRDYAVFNRWTYPALDNTEVLGQLGGRESDPSSKKANLVSPEAPGHDDQADAVFHGIDFATGADWWTTTPYKKT